MTSEIHQVKGRLRRPLPQWAPLVLILAGAAMLRLWGITWGLPGPTHLFSYHPDEFHSLRGALSLLLLGDPNPHFFNYGSLYLYLAAAAAGLSGTLPPPDLGYEGMVRLLHDWTLAARLVTALCGLLTVAVVYRLGDLLGGRRLGLAAALALAVMPLHVLHSTYATVDVPQTFFISLTMLFAVRMARGGTVRDYVMAGLCAGLAASVKYSGVLVIVAPMVAHLVMQRDPEATPRLPLLSLWPLAMLGVAGLAFLLTSPYTWLDWSHARVDILYEIQHMRIGEEPAKSAEPNGLLFHARCLLLTTTGLSGLALLGIAGLVRRQLGRLVLGPLIFGLLWTTVMAGANVRYLRYEIPLTPLIAILGVAAAWILWVRRPEGRLLALAIPVIAIGLSLGTSVQLVETLRNRPDPRDLALDEVLRRVTPDRNVGMVWEPWFQAPPLDRCNGGQVLRANPLWSRYSAPARPLVITGLDAVRVRTERPSAYVTSNFEVRDWERVGDPAAQAFVAELERDYTTAVQWQRQAPLDGLWNWQPPQDWLYPFPIITLHLRREDRLK